MKWILLLLLAIGSIYTMGRAQAQVPLPTPAQLTWQDAELVALFSYDLHVFDGKRYNQPLNRITPIPDYNIFNPTRLDTDQWIKAAKDAGIKIAVLTATHETGFALYQSDVNPYSLKSVQWRNGQGDIVKDFIASCRKYDVLPGIYIGIRWNSFMGIYDFKVSGTTQMDTNRQQYYNKLCEGMVEELVSRYGELAMVWFDGGAHGPELGGADVLGVFEKYQKSCIFYHNTQRADIRWGGSESGTVPYPSWGTYPFPYSHSTNHAVVLANDFELLKRGDPNGKYYMPAMSDAPLRGYNGRHEWFWEPGDEAHIFPLKHLIDMYYKSVGRNTSLILGLTPDADGLLPEPDVQRLKEWGAAIRDEFATPLATTSGNSQELVLPFSKKQAIDRILIMEDIAQGERVRQFVVEAKTSKGWVVLVEGSCIGHKFLHRFDPIEASALRLRITQSVAPPHIKSFQVFQKK